MGNMEATLVTPQCQGGYSPTDDHGIVDQLVERYTLQKLIDYTQSVEACATSKYSDMMRGNCVSTADTIVVGSCGTRF